MFIQKKANHLHVPGSLYIFEDRIRYLGIQILKAIQRTKKRRKHTEYLSTSSYWKYFDWKRLVDCWKLKLRQTFHRTALANWFWSSVLSLCLHFIVLLPFSFRIFVPVATEKCYHVKKNLPKEMFSIFNYPLTSKWVLKAVHRTKMLLISPKKEPNINRSKCTKHFRQFGTIPVSPRKNNTRIANAWFT